MGAPGARQLGRAVKDRKGKFEDVGEGGERCRIQAWQLQGSEEAMV